MDAGSPIRAYDVEVAAATRLSPTFRRITFAGPSLAQFHRCGPLGPRDLRIKLVVPPPGRLARGPQDFAPGWYPRWLALDPAERGWLRTYTVRAIRGEGAATQVDVDFVLHGHGLAAGPASAWATAASAGDPVTLLGPVRGRDDYGGIEWAPPPRADRPVRVLLAGDETAVPAIASILTTLPAGYVGHALLEVPDVIDVTALPTRADVEVSWLARGSRPHGEALTEAVATLLGAAPRQSSEAPDVDPDELWETPTGPTDGSFYAWVAGEAATVRELRRRLVSDLGIDRDQVAFMGYWRAGKPQTT